MCLQEAIRLRIGRHPPRIGTLLAFALSLHAESPLSGQTEPFKGLTPPALVQTGPSVCAPLVGTLPNGTVVTVLERCGTGRRTSGNDLTGYVYTSAFHASEPPSLSVPQQGGGVAGPVKRPSRLAFGILAGASIPLRDLADATTTGWAAAVRVDLRVVGPLAFGVDGGYVGLRGRRLETSTTPSPTLWHLGGHLRLGGSTGPYLIGGAGLYHFRSAWSAGAEDASDLGINAGIGLRLRLAGISTIFETSVENLRYKNGLVVPITLGFGY